MLINKNSVNNNINKNSFTRYFIEFQLTRIQNGTNNAVNIIKNIEIPSRPKE